DKPLYVGMSVLDISKTHMYDFHYNKMVSHFGRDRIAITYGDTDAYIYEFKTEDMYEVLKTFPYKDEFDFSDYPSNHPNHNTNNKKSLGKFKDEVKGVIIEEMVSLRPKMYAIKLKPDPLTKDDNEEEDKEIE
uniref:hypothetical protein n=1 Tax=Klebsiella pneumoniae TaxID=573 RepID=UPI00163DB3FF